MYIPRKTSPLELLLHGALRYLGRGFTFDDIEEDTFISADKHCCFFHSFTKCGADFLYNTYVWMPDSVSEVTECNETHRIAGLPLCIGSSDATHVPLKKVCYSFCHAYLGFKSKATTRYNIVVNHKRRSLSSSSGHPGRWNDKTIVKFDLFLERLQNGEYDDMLQFELLNNESSSGNEGFKGAYVIADNGYLDWSTTVPRIKNSCVG
jgi:DDE superfamily endonuclease